MEFVSLYKGIPFVFVNTGTWYELFFWDDREFKLHRTQDQWGKTIWIIVPESPDMDPEEIGNLISKKEWKS